MVPELDLFLRLRALVEAGDPLAGRTVASAAPWPEESSESSPEEQAIEDYRRHQRREAPRIFTLPRKAFVGEWAWLLILAEVVVAVLRLPFLPNEKQKAELSLKLWLSAPYYTAKHQRRRRRVLAERENGLVDALDILGARHMVQLMEAGKAGRFTTTGLVGLRLQTFRPEIWRAVRKIDFWHDKLILVDWTTIGGVRTIAAAPRDAGQQPGEATPAAAPVPDPIRQERLAVLRTVKANIQQGETPSEAVRRLQDEKVIGSDSELPGHGVPATRFRELLRLWHRV